MKISNNGIQRLYGTNPAEETTPLDRSAKDEATAGASALHGKDKASVSAEAMMLAKAARQADATPDVRTDKVADLRQKIDSGNYEIPYDEVVRRIAKNVRLGD